MSKKPIIVFEGIEGSGKSHHIRRIVSFLKKNKIDFIYLREPGGSPNSEKIRKLILSKKTKFQPKTDLLLYIAARNENISILKKNYKKKIILIDRFVDSTVAYQHYGMDLNINFINNINKFVLDRLKVDFTFLNVVSEKNMIKRLKKRKRLNRYDKFNKNFYKKVQKGFVKISLNNKSKYKLIDSNLEIKFNETIIIDKVKKLIK